MLEGAAERAEIEQQGRAWLAWHIAALPRVKRFPELRALMGLKPKPVIQTEDEMREVFKAWAKA